MRNVSKTRGQIIAAHTLTYFNFLNLFLAALILMSGQVKNMLFLGVVISNAVIGIVQEWRVKTLIDSLAVITSTKARRLHITKPGVLPDFGDYEEINTDDVRINDLLAIQTGDQLTCDGICLSSEGLEVNESLLTGESVPVIKSSGDLLYSGTHIVAGSGISRVSHVGDDNYAAKLVASAKKKRRATSEMQDAIKRIIRYVSFAILPIGLLLYYIQRHSDGLSHANAVVGTVAGVIGMIPEGLVLLTSVSFILGVGRLARKEALVQEMEAIEALARVNVLCLDKTGTITTGNLEVKKMISLCSQPESHINSIIETICHAFQDKNATSLALCTHFSSENTYPIDDKIPFSSERKFMGASLTGQGNFLLGAPDFLTADTDVRTQAEHYAAEGDRVLLLVQTSELATTRSDVKDTIPYALIVISDEIRSDARETLQYFADNHVEIKVISGDNPATVSRVATQAGLKGGEHYIDATTLPSSTEALAACINDYTVLGRVAPEQKQDIIKAFRASGKIVGMVGDGVNDVLAIKEADCGIAMAAGSDAAKQSAHIVLLKSDFSTMKDIIKEGRTIISNIERVSALYLTKTIYSVLLCLAFILMGKGYPFIPIQLSLIGATAIGIPSFFMTLEQNGDVTSTGFLKHVLRISLPFALMLVGSVTVLEILSDVLSIPATTISTLNLLIGGIISIAVVFRVCQPMNRRRFILCLAITFLFSCGFLFFPRFFGIAPTFLGIL